MMLLMLMLMLMAITPDKSILPCLVLIIIIIFLIPSHFSKFLVPKNISCSLPINPRPCLILYPHPNQLFPFSCCNSSSWTTCRHSICIGVIRADVIMEKEIKTRMAMNILNFEQDLHYETAEIRPHAGIDNFLWCMRKPS